MSTKAHFLKMFFILVFLVFWLSRVGSSEGVVSSPQRNPQEELAQAILATPSGHLPHAGHGRGGSHFHTPHLRGISNLTVSGNDLGCKHSTPYDTTPNVHFPMCTGQTDQDLKNGMSIINLVNSRGYLPTCRIMQLMLWMASTAHDNGMLAKETFVDIGANIGSCTVHMASLGFPVISAEPVLEHVNTIKGSMSINPTFQIDLQHIGVSEKESSIKANFGHGARNWGATEFHEVKQNETFELELQLRTLDQIVGSRRVSLMKVDCEGCEWAAIVGAKRSLKRIQMIKIELVQPDYTAGNETVSAQHILQYLQDRHFDLYVDHWNEQNLYFGKHGNDIMDIDRMFGSKKFNLKADRKVIDDSARLILSNPINASTFHQRNFMKQSTDVIAIERSLSELMKLKFL